MGDPSTVGGFATMQDVAQAGAQAQPSRRSAQRSGAAFLGIGSALSAMAMYMVMVMGARVLGDDRSALLVFIAAYQIVTGVLAGITTELTRAAASANATGRASGPRIVAVVVVVSIVLTTITVASSPLWMVSFPAQPEFLTAMVALTALGFTGHAALTGALSGRARWSGVGTVLTLEAGVRLILSVCAVILGLGLAGFAGATAGAAFAWLLLIVFSREARAAIASRVDVPIWPLTRRLAASIGALTATALLMAGFPMILALTTSSSEIANSPALLQAISLTRAPLLIPLIAFQTMLITAFVADPSRAGRLLARLSVALTVVTSVGSALAWAIGPWLMRVLFTYEISGMILALLTVAAGLLATLTLSGALCQSCERHRSFLLGWCAATATSVALLILPGSIELRTVVSLTAGPLVGLAVMCPGLLGAIRGARGTSPRAISLAPDAPR